jgi:hypothetical protein
LCLFLLDLLVFLNVFNSLDKRRLWFLSIKRHRILLFLLNRDFLVFFLDRFYLLILRLLRLTPKKCSLVCELFLGKLSWLRFIDLHFTFSLLNLLSNLYRFRGLVNFTILTFFLRHNDLLGNLLFYNLKSLSVWRSKKLLFIVLMFILDALIIWDRDYRVFLMLTSSFNFDHDWGLCHDLSNLLLDIRGLDRSFLVSHVHLSWLRCCLGSLSDLSLRLHCSLIL